MARFFSNRFVRLVAVLVLTGSHSVSAIAADPAPHRSASAITRQANSSFLPGFAEPSSDVTVVSATVGDVDPAVGAPATIVVERLRIAPGDEVPPVDGPQILQVEHGALSYVDDLGLDAELGAESSGFFPAGNSTPIVNEAGVPAIVVRTTLLGSATGDDETPPADTDGEKIPEPSPEPDDSEDAGPDQTGERPTPTEEEDGFTQSNRLAFARVNAKSLATATPVTSPAASTPEAAETATETATPTPTIEPTSTATPVPSTARLGVLLEADLSSLPAEAQQLFAARVELAPGAQLEISESSGPVALIAAGGDLSVQREGRAPSKLRTGLSVVLPTGITATLINEGDAPLTLQIGGVSGTAGEELEPEDSTEPEETPDAEETEEAEAPPANTEGIFRFVPTDSEMENLGLIAKPGEPQESSDPSQDLLWFSDGNDAEQTLEGYNWRSFLISAYDSNSEETEFGEVEFLAINVDAFASSDDATEFYNYIRDEIFGGGAGHSQDISNLEGVDAEMRDSFYNADSALDYGFMVIRSGEYTITIFVNGPDLNTIGMMEALAKLIFGARG